MVSQSYILPTAVTNVLRLFSVTEHQKFCQTDGIVPSDHSFCIIYISMLWFHTQIFQLACYHWGEARLF